MKPTLPADGDETLLSPALPAQQPAPGGTDKSGDGGDGPGSSSTFLARAALLTAVLSAAGSLLGLGRDQALAHLFGAGSETDAFLVAWTVPEVASTLLIEDGLAFMLVPAFSAAIAARGVPELRDQDPVRALVASSLPRLTLAFLACAVLLMIGAPQLVALLAPGLPDPQLAVDCTRLTATCVLTFGLAGYCSAALRAHSSYLAPAAIYVAYNTGIIGTLLVLADRWGVRAAAAGVAVGGCLMVLVQAPSLRRRLTSAAHGVQAGGKDAKAAKRQSMDLALIATVLLFALCRQAQVFIERFLASSLPSGAISHLNYAQKVAQLPMVLSLMLCTVTFPVVAKALARGDTERARDRVERDVALAACIVLFGAAVVFACAPQIIQLLFQRGAFTGEDTAATAAIMRVYSLGLLGHCLVGALVRSYFSAGRPTWYPVASMAAGMTLTAGAGTWAVGAWGVGGIAAANALGITFTAVLLLTAMDRRSVPVRIPAVLLELGKTLLAAVAATAAGLLCVARIDQPLESFAAGCLAIGGVFGFLLWALNVQAFLPAVRIATRKLRNAR
ncbi:murein biosynthesis integral membrane protein MurJ [Streptomyces longispororuber]|uniref:murein biosynthesis integral membrane protein MurJ n=1 Tax=Streptomyces longispororuber TaxID=68230 RepID=UPI00210D74FA|nr:lipid II flippase MurJ [Streptomyces longispororuber]MCQ4212879.1 MATE family efflux transporter [Streptomyces longispororuber]